MATYNFELNSKPTKKGTYVVLFRITENKKHKRIKTPIELQSEKHWNPNLQEVRKSDPNFKVLNESLKKIKENAIKATEQLEDKGRGVTSINIANSMKKGHQAFSFINFADEYAQRTLEAGDYRTYTKYITFLHKLKFFINNIKPNEIHSIPRNSDKRAIYIDSLKKDLLFDDITLSFLNKFKSYLKKVPNTKKPGLTLHQNTISKLFDNFKSLYRKGITELKEEGLVVVYNPFTDFECKSIETNKEKLTWNEIESIKALCLNEGSLMWHTRNCFMLSFYCAGMRAGDLIQLRGTNIVYSNTSWRVSYRMDKTSAHKEILLLPEALEILQQYINLDKRTSKYIYSPYWITMLHIREL